MTNETKTQLIEQITAAIEEDCRVLAFDAFTFDGKDIEEITAEMRSMGYTPEIEFDSDFNMYSIKF